MGVISGEQSCSEQMSLAGAVCRRGGWLWPALLSGSLVSAGLASGQHGANLTGLPVEKGPCRPSLGLAWEYIQGGGCASLSCLGLFSTQDSLGHLVYAIYLDFFSVKYQVLCLPLPLPPPPGSVYEQTVRA